MKLFRIGEFIKVKNPSPGTRQRQEILTEEQKAENLAGIFVTVPPGNETPYHYHNQRESIIIAISGEAIETVEGVDTLIKANDIIYIPAGEKHGMVNKTDKEFRFIEFFTGSVRVEDRVDVNRS